MSVSSCAISLVPTLKLHQESLALRITLALPTTEANLTLTFSIPGGVSIKFISRAGSSGLNVWKQKQTICRRVYDIIRLLKLLRNPTSSAQGSTWISNQDVTINSKKKRSWLFLSYMKWKYCINWKRLSALPYILLDSSDDYVQIYP